MRDEKEGRKKQARSYKQQGKATQHTQGSHLSLNNWAASGGMYICTTCMYGVYVVYVQTAAVPHSTIE